MYAYIFSVFALIVTFQSLSYGQAVEMVGGGINSSGEIRAMEYDSVGNRLIIGGEFRSINGILANNFAVWDGISWNSLNCQTNLPIKAIKVFNGEIYIGGAFNEINGVPCNHIAKWDGSNWMPVGSGLNGFGVVSMEIFQGELYAVNSMPLLGNFLNKFDGTNWIQIPGKISYIVEGMVSTTSALYLYGNLNRMNNDTIYGIISYNGSAYTYYPPLPNYQNHIYSAVIFNNSLYVARDNGKICSLQGNSWYEYTTAPDCERLFVYNNDLYLCGLIGGNYEVYKMSGGTYTAFQTFTAYYVANEDRFLAITNGNNLYMSGSFYESGHKSRLTLFQYDGTTLSNIGRPIMSFTSESSPNNYLFTMLYDSTTNDLYVGGVFDFAGEKYCGNIARWDGTQWHAMGDGFNEKVRKIFRYNGSIYAVGNFDKSGDVNMPHIARWDGSAWNSVGTGTNDNIHDAAVLGNEIFISGPFTTVNGQPLQYYAKYDGTTWSNAATNTLQVPSKRLIVHNDTLWAGGIDKFGANYSNLAQLKGNTWDIKTTNVVIPGEINSMLSFNGELYFTASDWDFYYLYKWNGDSIVSLGAVVNDICVGSCYVIELDSSIYLSGQNRGLHKFENNNTFTPKSTIYPLCAAKGDSLYYLGGSFQYFYFNQNYFYSYHIISLDFNSGFINPYLITDSICDHDFGYYGMQSNRYLSKYKWHFPGGSPDTAFNASPVIFYGYSGKFPSYLTYSDFAANDTIFLADSIFVIPCSTGMDEISANSINIFPNPVISNITIQSEHQIQMVEIFNSTGQLIKTIDKNNFSIEDYPRGLLLFRIKIDGKHYNRRVLKL